MKKILVIEDDESIRESLKDVLDLGGYVVEEASNGSVALEKLRSGETLPNLILLDLMMPEKDGFQFREEQRSHPRLRDIPVVILTADAMAEERLLEFGAKGYIRKPMDVETVLEVTQKWCD